MRVLVLVICLLCGAVFGDANAQLSQPPEEQSAERDVGDSGNSQEDNPNVTRPFVQRITADPALAILTVGLLVAAFWQVRISRDTARRELRAYVSIRTAGVVRYGPTMRFQCHAINAGQTPANNLVCGCKIILVEPARVADILAFAFDNELAKGAPWGPGQEVPLLIEERVLTDDEAARIEAGKLLVFVVGVYRYEDIFDRTRFTHFRYWIESDATGSTHLMAHDGGGNDAT